MGVRELKVEGGELRDDFFGIGSYRRGDVIKGSVCVVKNAVGRRSDW